jgi:hypothetical protein
VIHRGETYGDDHRRWIADNTNPDSFAGSLHDALRYHEPAKELISRLCLSDEFTDFLTLPAYEKVW